jgi:hypothetical protein
VLFGVVPWGCPDFVGDVQPLFRRADDGRPMLVVMAPSGAFVGVVTTVGLLLEVCGADLEAQVAVRTIFADQRPS